MTQDFIDKLTLVNIKDRKVLMVRGFGKEKFYTPGGKREEGEDDAQALAREIKEELSVNIFPGSLEYFATYIGQAHGKSEGKKVRLTCYFGKYSGNLKTSSEIEEMKWLDSNDKDLTTETGWLLISNLKSINLID